MAKRKSKKSRRGMYGFGNIISVRRGVDGVFDTGTVVGDALPVVLGGVVVLGTSWLVRKLVPSVAPASSTSGIASGLVQYAPFVGVAVGTLAGLGLVYGMGKRTAGTAMMASAATTGGVLFAVSKMPGVAGMGAIVPEYAGMGAVMPELNGLGATVLEQWTPGHRPDSIGALSGGVGDAYGTSVNLSGVGSVNTNAFGTPGFSA